MPMNSLEHRCWTKLMNAAARGTKPDPLALLGLTSSEDTNVQTLADMIVDLSDAYDLVKPPAPPTTAPATAAA